MDNVVAIVMFWLSLVAILTGCFSIWRRERYLRRRHPSMKR